MNITTLISNTKVVFLSLLALCATVFFLPQPASADLASYGTCESALFDAGAGTELDPWQIATPEQLANVTICTGSAHSDKYFMLTSDIDLDGYTNPHDAFGWLPIGIYYEEASYNDEQFYGTFDGNHHVVSNLTILNGRNVNYQGLFGGLFGEALVYDLGIEDVDITYDSGPIGALAGIIENSVLRTSYVKNVSLSAGSWEVAGGMAGVFADGAIEDSYATNVTITTPDELGFGGFAGVLDGTDVDRVYSEGVLTSMHATRDLGVGGISGFGGPISIDDSFTVVDISVADNDDEVGGMGGKWYSYEGENNYWLEDDDLDAPTACLGGELEDLAFCAPVEDIAYFKDIANEPLASWDIAYSASDINDGLPFLAWQVLGDEAETIWLVTGEIEEEEEEEESSSGERSRQGSRSSAQSRATAQAAFDRYYAAKNGEHKSAEESTDVDSSQEGNSTTEDILGSGTCPAELIIIDRMEEGDRDGQYGDYNGAVVTQVALLQQHINRILAAQYDQAAGPIDGIFGTLTKQGVERLQVALNEILQPNPLLDIDGIVGPFTKDAINMSCGS